MTAPRLKHALSFDIEDWFHLVEVPSVSDPATWDRLPSVVVERTREILAICAEAEVKGTFFIVGWVADRYPHLVREIAEAGHEIGTHTYWHRAVYATPPADFRRDIADSCRAIERACGIRPTGFRAPSFSMTPGTEWAVDVLLDEGIAYDASLHPGARAHGGYDISREATEIRGASGRMMPELPMATYVLPGIGRGLGFAYSGGGYLRLLPYPVIRALLRRDERRGLHGVLYLHPRDFAVDCPEAPMSALRRFKSYHGIATTAGKLRSLLRDFAWATCGDVIADRLTAGASHSRGRARR